MQAFKDGSNIIVGKAADGRHGAILGTFVLQMNLWHLAKGVGK
jgi:hypothetical protein